MISKNVCPKDHDALIMCDPCCVCSRLKIKDLESRLAKAVEEKDSYRKIAAKWAQTAQMKSGEGIDPGFNHCLEVIDEQVKKALSELKGEK